MQVSIVTPEEEVWRGEADLVVARSPEGEFGVIRGHIPFLASLVPGTVTVATGSESREVFFVPGGFLEASGPADDYHVIVLADEAEPTGELDAAEVLRRVEEARKQRELDEDAEQLAEAEMRVAMARPELRRD